MSVSKKPMVLVILDGYGYREDQQDNAIYSAKTPVMDALWAKRPHTLIDASGLEVGLPDRQMGNSEVGHVNLGAGRIVYQDLTRLDVEIKERTFFANPVLTAAVDKAVAAGKAVHIMGLMSPGGVHSHEDHIMAMVELAAERGAEKIYLHAFLDGRDTPPRSAEKTLATFEAKFAALGKGRVASLIGRYYAMDRDNRWERVGLAYDAMVKAEGLHAATPAEAVAQSYAKKEMDEFIKPTVIGEYAGTKDGDGFFCLNFRADRAREILRALAEPGFAEIDVSARPVWSALLGMVEYSTSHNAYMATAYPKRDLVNTLGEWVSKQGLTQFHCAETEKYPHVTFFLNGGKESPWQGEDRFMPKSPKVATYDLQPEMSAPEVTEHFIGAIEKGYDLIVVNYANPDMVGHTGSLPAAIKACEEIDRDMGKVIAALKKAGGAMIVTADHGNCETMIDPVTGKPHTAHTTNPVPVALIGGPEGVKLRDGGRLADLAPTLLELMQLPVPPEMTGKTLIVR